MFLKNILRFLYYNFFCYVLVSPLIFFFILISVFKKVRFGNIRSQRIGHTLANTEFYLINKRSSFNNRNLDIVYQAKEVANEQAFLMIKRKLKVFPSYFVHIHNFFRIFSKSKFEIGILRAFGERDRLNLLRKHENEIDFTKKEIDYGKEYLFKNFSCDADKDKIIYLCIRDSEYLNKAYPKGDWKYHNYRDWRVDNFILGCEYLCSLGYKIFRVGKFTNQKFVSKNPNIIDYVNSENRNDFMDIFLAKICKFAISTGLGIDNAPLIFRKPIAMIHVPFEFSYFHNQNLIMTKHHFSQKKARNLSISEIFQEGKKINFRYDSSGYKKNNISLVENSSEEIKEFLEEMHLIITNKIKDSQVYDKNLEDEFWKIFNFNLKKYDLENIHGIFSGNISHSFLKKNPYFLN